MSLLKCLLRSNFRRFWKDSARHCRSWYDKERGYSRQSCRLPHAVPLNEGLLSVASSHGVLTAFRSEAACRVIVNGDKLKGKKARREM